MKEINLLSITQAYLNLESDLFSQYLDYQCVSVKDDELDDLCIFSDFLLQELEDVGEFNRFYLGYKIPQISKEFDLLRFGENYIVNIELKKIATEEKIKKQLIRNKYYLSFLGVNILCFTFISNNKNIYRLDNKDDLIKEDIHDLVRILKNQEVKKVENIDSLFNPSNYLVSPFNSTDAFAKGEYFLTNQQEEIKKEAMDEIKLSKTSFISILGRAGTGKTLLTYDIAKDCMTDKLDVLIIHCGMLNQGHLSLRDQYGWDLIPIKNIYNKKIENYALIIIDEVQRIYPAQLQNIIREVEKNKLSCIFSYDKLQCLRKFEINNNIEEVLDNGIKPVKYELTEKIRTNKEIASFIRCLFDKRRQIDKLKKPNVELNYFKSYTEATDYIKSQQALGWKVVNYTPSRKHRLPYDNFAILNEDNAHEVIGQEFDKVIAVVDSHFYYNENNKLSTRDYKNNPYYHPTKMLLQIMTRIRRKLNFIVINNNELLERSLSILKAEGK